jgi:uroporphyrinogen-III synthase
VNEEAVMPATGDALAGCVFVVTADRRRNELATALARRGASVIFAPALSTVAHLDDDTLLATTRRLIASPPDIVVATTGIGFRGWVETADAAGLAEPLVAALRGARIIARGPKALGAIQAAGLEADWVAASETAAELQEYLLSEELDGLSIAIQHHGAGADGLDEAFAAAGAHIESLVVYSWAGSRHADEHVAGIRRAAAGSADAVIFTSAPAAVAWLDTVRAEGVMGEIASRIGAAELMLACVGPVTSAPLEAAGLTTAYPDRWRLGALVRMLVERFGEGAPPILTADGPLVMRATAAVLDGRLLPLSPTGFEILRTLARAGGNVVTRDRLAELLPSGSTGNHAVEAAINRLRDTAGSRGLVRTVVKRGYALGVVGT